MKRETGYYWVKYKDQWFINYWSGSQWMEYTKKPMAMFFEGFEFTEINETRIKTPDEIREAIQYKGISGSDLVKNHAGYKLQGKLSPQDELNSLVEQWNDLEFTETRIAKKYGAVYKKQVEDLLNLHPHLVRPSAKIFSDINNLYI